LDKVESAMQNIERTGKDIGRGVSRENSGHVMNQSDLHIYSQSILLISNGT